MEPANLHPQHHLQEQYGGYYSSLLFQPEYKASSNNNMNPDIFLESWQPYRGSLYPAGSMCFCATAAPPCLTQQSADELLLSKIKEEMTDSFPGLSEIVSSPCTDNILESHSVSTMYKHDHHHDENQWLCSNFSSAGHVTELQLSAGLELNYCNNNVQDCTSILESSSSASSRSNYFSHFLPSINISNSDLDLNLQAVDLLTPKSDAVSAISRKQKASQNSSFDHFMGELIKESPASSSNKASDFEDAIQRKKRSRSFVETKKKHDPPSRSSCPPLKVRKENLRDRIANLQRLVAPYGKTDTASVLTEAIGYIHFLHDQVQTLSVPYMRSSNSNPTRKMHASSSEEDGKRQPKRDLVNRGLRLVPLSCVSFFNGYSAGI